MPEDNEKKYKVYSSNGGLRITVPKSIVKSMDIGRKNSVKWLVKNENELFMIISNDDEDYKLYNINGQFRVTLPKSLASALGIKEGSYVKWILHSNKKLVLRRMK